LADCRQANAQTLPQLVKSRTLIQCPP
jgi:hypothetical protein